MHLNAAVTIERIIKVTFLLNRKYCPGYAKWRQREFRKLPLGAGEIESLLMATFMSGDDAFIVANLEHALDIIYAALRKQKGLPELPREMPRVHHRGTITIDTQKIARILLGSIPRALGQLHIHGAPYGAVDQWVTNEDLLLAPEHMKAAANIYKAQELDRIRFDDMI